MSDKDKLVEELQRKIVDDYLSLRDERSKKRANRSGDISPLIAADSMNLQQDLSEAYERIKALEAKLTEARKLLEVAACPNTECIDGWYYDSNNTPARCQFCAKREKLLRGES